MSGEFQLAIGRVKRGLQFTPLYGLLLSAAGSEYDAQARCVCKKHFFAMHCKMHGILLEIEFIDTMVNRNTINRKKGEKVRYCCDHAIRSSRLALLGVNRLLGLLKWLSRRQFGAERLFY